MAGAAASSREPEFGDHTHDAPRGEPSDSLDHHAQPGSGTEADRRSSISSDGERQSGRRVDLSGHSSTMRGKYSDTTQFGWSTISLIRRSAQTLHSM